MIKQGKVRLEAGLDVLLSKNATKARARGVDSFDKYRKSMRVDDAIRRALTDAAAGCAQSTKDKLPSAAAAAGVLPVIVDDTPPVSTKEQGAKVSEIPKPAKPIDHIDTVLEENTVEVERSESPKLWRVFLTVICGIIGLIVFVVIVSNLELRLDWGAATCVAVLMIGGFLVMGWFIGRLIDSFRSSYELKHTTHTATAVNA